MSNPPTGEDEPKRGALRAGFRRAGAGGARLGGGLRRGLGTAGMAGGLRPGLPLRAVIPNAITALALCAGLTGIRFALSGDWELAVSLVIIAGVLDGLDGRVARMLHGESRFGAELDSLADAISFGVAPALILYLWSLSSLPRIGWLVALLLAVFCALRLARFNAQIDREDQPHKSAGYLTGVPAPAGAALALLPMFLWFWTGEDMLRHPLIVAPWVAATALLMVSSIATFSARSFRLRSRIRFEALALLVLLGAALVSAPWHTLSFIGVAYLLTLPFSIRGYARIRRQRAAEPGQGAPDDAPPASRSGVQPDGS